MNKFREIFFLFKIHHSIKNIGIFLPLVAGHSIMSITFSEVTFHFINFTVIASIVYLFNNIKDYPSDINNKKLKYSINLENLRGYYLFGITILFIQLIILILLAEEVIKICILYFFISIAYNYYFKQKKYLDIIIISIFHLLRIYYGAIAFEIELSLYFVLFCLAIFLMISANKRLTEVYKKYENRPYKIVDKENLEIIQLSFAVFAVLIFLLYSFDSSKNIFFINHYYLYLNFFIIVLLIGNFIYSQKKKQQDIIEFIYKNKINGLLVLLFFISFFKNSVLL